MVVGLLGNKSSGSNRFTLVAPKPENGVRLQAKLGNQNPTGLPVGVVRKEALYRLVAWIAVVHDKFNGLNDAYEYNFTDKQMHFLIIGLLGMAMTFLLVPIVKLLVQKKMVLTLTWFYVITVLIVITFAIEIGQGFTHTGAMDFADIVAGIYGFLVMFALYAVVRGLIILIHKLTHRK